MYLFGYCMKGMIFVVHIRLIGIMWTTDVASLVDGGACNIVMISRHYKRSCFGSIIAGLFCARSLRRNDAFEKMPKNLCEVEWLVGVIA